MAEGFWRHYGGETWEVFSAGIMAAGVHPLAIEAMAEVGIDISDQESEAVNGYVDEAFDLVITVCADAEHYCPRFPSAGRKEHWPFDDPVGAMGSEEDRMREFRRVRDQIGAKIRAWLEERR